MRMRTIGKALVLAMAVSSVAALSVAQTAQKPAFEAASVKLNKTGARLPTRTISPGSLIYADTVLAEYIQLAYGLKYRQLEGPQQIFEDRYDISAKASGPVGPEGIKLMLGSLLEDRLQLKFHRESREMAVSLLMVAKNGPAFRASAGDGPLTRRITRDAYEFRNASISDLVELMNSVGNRFVLDKTGLSGRYDFDIKLYDMPVPSETDSTDQMKIAMRDAIEASILSAIQSLGLRLDGDKAMVEVMVVDSIQRPMEN